MIISSYCIGCQNTKAQRAFLQDPNKYAATTATALGGNETRIRKVKLMQISEGKIELNNISFEPDTCIDDVFGNPRFQSYKNNNSPVDIFTSEQINISGYTFNAKIVFIERQLAKIQLVPVNLKMKDPGYPDEEYQKEKKKVADSLLRNNLGKPSKESEAVLFYDFKWGSVSSVAFLSGRNEYTGGFIELSYKDK